MATIKINTGVKEYTLEGVGTATVYFNPTDTAFIDNIFSKFEKLDAKQDEYRARIADASDLEVFQIGREMNKEMRDTIDDVYGAPICDAIFGNMSVYAAADGLPLWANLLLATIDEMDEAFTREKKATNPRIQKYTEKYSRKQR